MWVRWPPTAGSWQAILARGFCGVALQLNLYRRNCMEEMPMKRLGWLLLGLLALVACGSSASAPPSSGNQLPTVTSGVSVLAPMAEAPPLATIPPPKPTVPQAPVATSPPAPAGAIPLVVMADAVW